MYPTAATHAARRVIRGAPATAPARPQPFPEPQVPKALNARVMGFRLIVCSIPLLAVSSLILYKRFVLGEEQRKQEGFITEDGVPVKFSDLED